MFRRLPGICDIVPYKEGIDSLVADRAGHEQSRQPEKAGPSLRSG